MGSNPIRATGGIFGICQRPRLVGLAVPPSHMARTIAAHGRA
jgi:hypothetical protein